MIEKVTIRNWQSLVALDVELARFTAIVGPSSSGKSAFLRALRAVASNVSGTDKITRGAKNAAITVTLADTSVTLEYGKFSSDTAAGWFYRLHPHGGKDDIYTKLNRSVPEQITAALRIDPVPTKGASLNFAGQHDPPFLLSDSGANIARTLGELTGVDRIFEAGREAVRRRNALAATLRTREADLTQLTSQASRFTDLPARAAALRHAEQAADRAAHLRERVTRLQEAIDQLTVAEIVLGRAVLPDAPTADAAQALQDHLSQFETLWRYHTDQARAAEQWQQEAATQAALEDQLHQELHAALLAAGTCPTCGRGVAAG